MNARRHAIFDETDHCTEPGWATYHRRNAGRCRLFWPHLIPYDPPDQPDVHSPSNYERCGVCGAPIKWYVFGQHRYGGIGGIGGLFLRATSGDIPRG